MPEPSVNLPDYPSGTVIHNHPEWKYRAAPGLSSTALKCFANQSPRHYQYHFLGDPQPRTPSDAMVLGSLVHCMVLEPDKVKDRYLHDSEGMMRTLDDFKQYCREQGLAVTGKRDELMQRVLEHDPQAPVFDVICQNTHKTLVKQSIWEAAERMCDSVRHCRDAQLLLSHGDAEVSVWREDEDTGLLCKCRADLLRNDRIVVDLKTAACASPAGFARAIAQHGYDLQDQHYCNVLDTDLMLFIVVESEPPYLCQVYELDDYSRSVTYRRYRHCLDQMAECIENKAWPGYSDMAETLSLPGWYLKQYQYGDVA